MKAIKKWTIDVDGQRRTVRYLRNAFTGKFRVLLDEELLAEDKKSFYLGGSYPLNIAGRNYKLVTLANLLNYTHELTLDDRSVETGEPIYPPGPIPWWGWLFIIACLLVPVVTMGGALPAGVAGGGMAACAITLRDTRKSTGMQVLICAGITAICWLVLLMLIGATVFASLYHH